MYPSCHCHLPFPAFSSLSCPLLSSPLLSSHLFSPLLHCLRNNLPTSQPTEIQQVAERALFLWNNEQLVTSGVLSQQYPCPLLPWLYGPLFDRSTRHWNSTVEGLANNVLKMYSEQDADEYQRCHQQHLFLQGEKGRRRKKLDEHWVRLEELARAKASDIMLGDE
ncbi:unnamed protein product [Discosporangium mesarthrocarpum]